jgi:hypothetical protein
MKYIITESQYDYVKLIGMLQKTKLYNLLDNITKVRYLNGNVMGDNSGGGLRLFIYDGNGNLIRDLSINGYNVSRATDSLLELIESRYLNGDILKELKSIARKTSENVSGLIKQIISLIMEREPIEDTDEEMVDRWFDNVSGDMCRLIKQSPEDSLENMKRKFLIAIVSHYNLSPFRLDGLIDAISKKFDDCRN